MSACTAARHGTRAAYTTGCRCPEARAANTTYAAMRKRRTVHAQFGAAPPMSVPVERAHIELARLEAAGWSRRRIAVASGLPRNQLARILGGTYRPVRTVRWDTFSALQRLGHDAPAPVAPGALVDATPTWRRLQALIAIGWPKTTLARRLGLGRALQLHQGQVTARNAAKVAALYRELAYTPGPSQRARQYAAAHGWLSAMFWDDRIDDLTFHPFLTPLDDEDQVDDLAPRRRSEVLLEDIAWLEQDGLSPELIASRLGISVAYIDKLRERAAS